MLRTAQEIADGVLGCVPESAPERGTLRRRIRKAMNPTRALCPAFTARELSDLSDQMLVYELCQICGEVLGQLPMTGWVEQVAQYLAAGDQSPAEAP